MVFVATLATCVLAACTVGPDFRPPAVEAPSVWGPEPADVPSRTITAAVDPQWWRTFKDDKLMSLVNRLVAQNLDLKSAAERIVQGRAQRQATAAQALPQINEQSTYTRTRLSPTGIVTLTLPAPGAPLEYDLWQNGANASWELDLFGRIRRSVEAADANTMASVENRRGIALSALAELAQDYLQLRGTQARLTIAERNLLLAEQNTKLVRDQFANGVATTLDMAQAQAQQASVAGTLPTLRTQEASLINAIGLLLAEQPRVLDGELRPRGPTPGVPPLVPIGLPGSLVRSRPDVRQAEAQLHAATAQTGVAVASFYPDVSLSGLADLNGLRLANAFSLPSSAFQIGPSISVPIFRGGQLTGELRLRESQQREAAISFQRTVLQAWQEVDNALTAYAEAQRRRAYVAQAAKQNETALAAARQRYKEGVADFLNVVSSQSQLLQSQTDLASSDTEIATDLVTIYRALGGGWEAVEPVDQPRRPQAPIPSPLQRQ